MKLTRKPPTVGLVGAVLIFGVLIAYAIADYFSSENGIMSLVWLFVSIIIFTYTYVILSQDIHWLELFPTPKFQKNMITLMALLAASIVICIILSVTSYADLVEWIVIIFLVLLIHAFGAFAIDAQKSIRKTA